MSAAGRTAPVTIAILISASLSGAVLYGLSLDSEDVIQTETSESKNSENRPDCNSEALIETLVWNVPAGSFLIVGSLDRTARTHRVTVAQRSEALAGGGRQRAESLTSNIVDVHRVAGDDIKAIGRRLVNRPIVRSRPSNLPSDAAAAVRRFSVPLIRSGRVGEHVTAGRLLYRGNHVQVFAATGTSTSTVCAAEEIRLAAAITNVCESDLLPFLESQYTPLVDIDGDGMLTFVLCDLQAPAGDCSPNQAEPILGCVRQNDFLDPVSDFSGDIIYLDRRLTFGDDLSAILMHELTHAATFSHIAKQSCDAPDAVGPVPIWLNESIAHYFEMQVVSAGSNLQARIAAFVAEPQRFPFIVPDNWHLSASGRGGCRAAGALFLECVIENNPQRFNIASLLDEPGDAVQRIEAVTGKHLAELFREWTISLVETHLMTSLPTEEEAKSSVGEQPRIKHRVMTKQLSPDRPSVVDIRGTSAAFFETSIRDSSITVIAAADSRIQITVVTPGG